MYCIIAWMESPLVPGQSAPAFTLLDLQGQPYSLPGAPGKVVVLNFWSAECPGSARVDQEIQPFLARWGSRVAWWLVASNANEPPDLLLQAAQERAARERGAGPVLHDPHNRVADLYGAQTTPHLFVIDTQGILRYQGSFDDVTFRRRIATRGYVVEAVEALLAARQPEISEVPACGCAIIREEAG